MNLTPDQWSRISGLLDEALDLTPAERPGWLESLGASNAALKDELRRLLERHADIETSDFLETLPKLGAEMTKRPEPGVTAGTVIGPYVVDAEVGRGGMGIVYRAHRADGLIKRPVALKLLHPGVHSSELLDRFARERDILAGLTHPNIARLYDAGFTESGQPYIALEFVEGLPLAAYCDAHRLGLRARLGLMGQVLTAVQFAHANLVIHRDLKPSNILVTAAGEVRLLDFGIAKLQEPATLAVATQVGVRALTPDYASPEQILGEAVSTASDVYSLGVVLYELLCGSRPYRVKRGSVAALEEAIVGADLLRPSQAEISDAAAAARATSARALARSLVGDLDTITLKALRRPPAERYATADAFEQDLRHYLDGEPVLARPDSAWYRARKFLKRNRLAVGAALGVVVALAAGLAVALWQARRANEEARVARSVQAFLQDVFEANSKAHANPSKAQQTTARELLDAGAAKIDTALADSPRARLEVLETLGAMYHDLGLDEKSVDLQLRRVELARQLYGTGDVRLAAALRDLSVSLADSSRVEQRPALLTEALGILDRAGDRSSALRANVLGDLAQHYAGFDLPKALEYARASRALLERQPPSLDVQEAFVMEGTVLNQMGRSREANDVLSRALEVSKQAFGDPNPHLSQIDEYLAESRFFLADFAGAEQAYRAAYEVARNLEGPNHIDTLQGQARLGLFLSRTGRVREGVGALRDAHARASAALSADDAANLPLVRELYGYELARFGALDEGYALLADATGAWHRHYADSAWMLSALERSAYIQVDRGDYATARRLVDDATRIRTALKDVTTFPTGNVTARIHLALALGDWAAADEAIGHYRVPPAPPGALSLAALDVALSRAEIALGRADHERARALAAETADAIRTSAVRDYLRAYEARALWTEGSAILASDQPELARPVLEESVRLHRAVYDPDLSVLVAGVDADLARCLAALGRWAEARTALAQANAIFGRHPSLGAHWRQRLSSARAAVEAAGRRANLPH